MKCPTKAALILTKVAKALLWVPTPGLGSGCLFLSPGALTPFCMNNKSTKARGRTANMALRLLSLVSFCISICCIKTMKISSPPFCFQQQSTAALMQMTRAGITAVNRISSPLMSSALSGALLWVHQHRRVTPTEFPGLIVGGNLPGLVVAFILKFSKQRRRRPRRSSRPADLTTVALSPLIFSPVDSLGHFRPRWDEGVYSRSRKWLLFHACGTETGARIHPMTVSIAANRGRFRPGKEIGFPKGQPRCVHLSQTIFSLERGRPHAWRRGAASS